MNQKRHKHADLIHAWADGADIEYLNNFGVWSIASTPTWSDDLIYRIKPKTVTTIKYRVYLTTEGFPCITKVDTPPNWLRWLGDWQEVEVEL